jgi:hypothetical protein
LYECHICGKKSYSEDDLDICDKCGKIVCIDCSFLIDGRTVCEKCIPKRPFDEDYQVTEEDMEAMINDKFKWKFMEISK